MQEEFAHQGEMERQVGMESCLFGGPPEIGNMLKLANGQIGFMSLFGLPLFEGVANILPSMAFAVRYITENKDVWLVRAEQEKHRENQEVNRVRSEGPISPRSQSPKRDEDPAHLRSGGYQRGAGGSSLFTSTSLDDTWLVSSSNSPLANADTDDNTSPGRTEPQPLHGTKGIAVTDMEPSVSPHGSSAALGNSNVQTQPPLQTKQSSNTVPSSKLHNSGGYDANTTTTEASTPATSQRDGSSENERPRIQKPSNIGSDQPNTAYNGTRTGTKQSLSSSCTVSTPSGDRPSSSTQADYHHHQQASSGMEDCSKHTVSTIMTPASTQATSFLSEATDEKAGQNGSLLGLNTSTSNESKSHFRTTILSHAALGRRSAPASTSGNGNGHGHENGLSKTLPRKRSRMRLAFWKKPRSYETEEIGHI